MIFVDTSAFLAILSTGDINHQGASLCWRNLIEEDQTLFTNNYVIVESIALIQKRLGLEKVRDFQTKILALLQIEWVDEAQNITAIETVLQAHRRKLSLIDCSAFQTMNSRGINTVFTFDDHFREQGFNVIPD
jgi:predicted nucleic acid-binding protein